MKPLIHWYKSKTHSSWRYKVILSCMLRTLACCEKYKLIYKLMVLIREQLTDQMCWVSVCGSGSGAAELRTRWTLSVTVGTRRRRYEWCVSEQQCESDRPTEPHPGSFSCMKSWIQTRCDIKKSSINVWCFYFTYMKIRKSWNNWLNHLFH